jgi:hypothetical protein
MTWRDALVSSNLEDNLALRALSRLTFTDNGTPVHPGQLDLASLASLQESLSVPGRHLHLQLPRGSHDFAIFLGLFAHLARIVAKHTSPRRRVAFDGPVVVVGMNTMV